MKRILLLMSVFCIVVISAFAEGDLKSTVVSVPEAVVASTTASAATIATATVVEPVAGNLLILKGDLIDNICANANKDTLADFVKTHTKKCALAPGCIESGYVIFSNAKLYKFAKDSNSKVVEFLRKDDSKLQVEITAKEIDGELSLVSIENQK